MKNQKAVVECALANPESLSAAFATAEAVDAIKGQILLAFFTRVVELVKTELGETWEFVDTKLIACPLESYATIKFRPRPNVSDWGAKFCVGVSYEGKRYLYGVTRAQPESPWPPVGGGSRLVETLNEAIDEKGRESALWPWYSYLDHLITNTDDFVALQSLNQDSESPATVLSRMLINVSRCVREPIEAFLKSRASS